MMPFPFKFNKIDTIEYNYDLEGCSRITLSGKLSLYPHLYYIFKTNLEDKDFNESNNIKGTPSKIIFLKNDYIDEKSPDRERLINSSGLLFCTSLLENWNGMHPSKKRTFTIPDLELHMSVLIYMSDVALDELCKTTQRTRNISYVEVYPYGTYQTKDGTFYAIHDRPLELKIDGLDDDTISKLENPTLEERGQLLIENFDLNISLKNK